MKRRRWKNKQGVKEEREGKKCARVPSKPYKPSINEKWHSCETEVVEQSEDCHQREQSGMTDGLQAGRALMDWEWTENERSVSVSVHTAAEGGLRPHHLRWNHQINRTELFSNPPSPSHTDTNWRARTRRETHQDWEEGAQIIEITYYTTSSPGVSDSSCTEETIQSGVPLSVTA